ncbi:MAG: hypothetical protein LBC02_06720 [Planctomycetaceae bacterium]|jgi:hypothetical protein|nr:hypothetical protein [Planctomycetaceae bacterium]
MTSNNFENTTTSSIPLSGNTETNRTSESAEFFDRERWHDVESENNIAQEEPVPHNKIFSDGFLLLVAVIVIAGVCGITVAYYLSYLMQNPTLPELDYRSVQTQWVGYVEDSVFFCEVNNPLCFASDGHDKFYIGDENPPSVREFSIKTKQLRTIPLPFKPMAIAVGGSEQLFADQLVIAHSDRIAVYSMDGELRFSWQIPNTKSAIWSLAVTDHVIYAADTEQRLIYQFDEKGILLKTFGQPSAKKTNHDNSNSSNSESVETFSGFSVYLSPITLAVSRKTGLIHITNPGQYRVETFTSEGHWEPLLSWGNTSGDLAGFAGCCNPVSIAVLADGRIVTAEKFITRVKVFRVPLRKGSTRRLDCIVAGPEVLDKQPPNIPQLVSFRLPASETGRSVFVTTIENDVVVFDPVMRVIRYFTALSVPKEERE